MVAMEWLLDRVSVPFQLQDRENFNIVTTGIYKNLLVACHIS